MELVESSTGDTQKHHLLLILSSNTLIVVINLIKCNVDIQTQNIKLINPGIRSKLCLTLWYLVTQISKPLFNRYIDTGPFFCYLGENTNVATMYFPGDSEVSWISLPDYEQTSRCYYKY